VFAKLRFNAAVQLSYLFCGQIIEKSFANMQVAFLFLKGGDGNNGSAIYCGAGNGNTNGNGNGRLTSKQYKYILKLNQEQGRSSADLDQQCLNMFGSVAQYLSKADASTVIEQMLAG
jgi:hypothetical protein